MGSLRNRCSPDRRPCVSEGRSTAGVVPWHHSVIRQRLNNQEDARATVLTARPTFPGWRLLAKLGAPVEVRVSIEFDAEARVYYVAESDLRGLHVEAATLDEMQREILGAATELLHDEFNNGAASGARIIMHSAATCAA